MNQLKLCILTGTALLMATQSIGGFAAPARKAHAAMPDPQDQPGDVLFYKLGPKAPFARVEIDNLPDSCGRLGCQIAITGVSRTGQKTDITFAGVFTNASIGSYSQTFGRVDASGMPYIVLEQGLVDGGSSFNLFAYIPTAHRYRFERQVSGYAEGKRLLPPASTSARRTVQPALAPPPPSLPSSIEYIGVTGSERFRVFNDFTIMRSGDTLGGSGFIQLGIFSGAAPLTGTYTNGECSVTRKKQTWRGPCDGNEFSGFTYDSKGKQGEPFRFRTEAYLARIKAARGEAAPVVVANSGAPRAYTSVWSLGRARFLVEPRGGCPPEIALGTRSYCFTQAINWLRRHPDKQSVDVVAMDNARLVGSLVPHNNGQGWDIYKVSRQGDGFTAATQRHYSTQVRVPQGCIYENVAQQGWYIGIDHNGKVAIEAASYVCANGWSGAPIYARLLDTSEIDARPGEIRISDMAATGGNSPSAAARNRPGYGAGGYNPGASYDAPPRPNPGYDRLAGTSADITGEPSQAADHGGPPDQRDDYLWGTSATISGQPDTGHAPVKRKPKPKR